MADTAATSPQPVQRTKRSYTEEEKERGLLELALCAGNYRLAAERLGGTIPGTTLQNWATKSEVDRYERIQNDAVPRLHARLAAEHEKAAFAALEAQDLAISLTRQQLEQGQIKDASTAARNLATVAGISTDKATLTRGRPTAIVEQRSSDEIMNALALKLQRLTGQTVDTTAEELDPEPQTIEETSSADNTEHTADSPVSSGQMRS